MSFPALGIDVAKKTIRVALLREDKVRQKSVENNATGFKTLAEWLTKQGVAKVHACLEATNTYGEAVATFLFEAGHDVSIVNPAQIKAYGASELKRNKTDPADAALIARFCQTHKPRLWAPPPKAYRELKALVRRLDALKEMRQREMNRLEGATSVVAASVHNVVRDLDEEIRRIMQQISDHIDRHPDLKQQHELLNTIPGFGDLTSARFLAEVGDVKRYRNARQVAAYIGVTPARDESGDKIRKTVMAKLGNARLRKDLYMPAIVAKKHNPILRAFCERLLAKRKSAMAVVGAAMRKLVHIAYGVLKNGTPFDAEIAMKGA